MPNRFITRMISPNRWSGRRGAFAGPKGWQLHRHRFAIFATAAAQKSPPFATGQVQGEKRRKSFAASQA
jgi:hypothetical protein